MQPSENDLANPELRPFLEQFMRGKDKDVEDLQRLSTEELRIEVRGSIQNLLAEAERSRMTRAVQGISSPGELSAEARALLKRAPVLEKSVKTD